MQSAQISRSRHLVLASTSIYRLELLRRLAYPFDVFSPIADETPLPKESPLETALRLSTIKAKAAAETYPTSLIIGSDQVAHEGGRIFGKPGTHELASRQLRELSGKSVEFISGVCVYDSANMRSETRAVVTRVLFRKLSDETIERYVRLDQPFNCAGSAKSESLGIALIARMDCSDPTALVGLPLITLCDLLELHGQRVV